MMLEKTMMPSGCMRLLPIGYAYLFAFLVRSRVKKSTLEDTTQSTRDDAVAAPCKRERDVRESESPEGVRERVRESERE